MAEAVSKPVWHIPLLCVQWKTPDDGQMNCPKHIEFYSKNKFQKLLHLVGFIIRILVINLSLLVWILLSTHCKCRGLLLGGKQSMTDSHIFSKTPLGERSASSRDLYGTTHTHILPQQTDIHAPGEVGTRNPSRRAAADPRPRPRDQRDSNLYRRLK